MTRGQVARRLGKSIATVRRLEGVLLNPVQDELGVWHFDDAEVDRLAAEVRSGDVSLWGALGGVDGVPSLYRRFSKPCRRCFELEQRVAELETALALSQTEQAGQLARISSLQAAARARTQGQALQLYRDVAEIVFRGKDTR